MEKKEISDLQETITAAEKDIDVVVVGTPMNLKLVLKIEKPTVTVGFVLKPKNPDGLFELIRAMLEGKDFNPILKKIKDKEAEEREVCEVPLDEGEIGAHKIQEGKQHDKKNITKETAKEKKKEESRTKKKHKKSMDKEKQEKPKEKQQEKSKEKVGKDLEKNQLPKSSKTKEKFQSSSKAL